MKPGILSLYLLSTVTVYNGLISPSTAQISSDGTVSTTVTNNNTVNFLIENGDRAGDNLFHSFREFSVPNFGEAYFNNATDIVNIFSRVTGGNISDIQGLIRANGTANLFLINPAGIIFGENASLDIGGSFFATTAESVVFGDGIEFSAIEPQEAPLLTINITPGLQYGANPLPIEVSGSNLAVNSGQSISLLGGDVVINNSTITAPGGNLQIAAIASNNLLNLNQNDTINPSNIETFQNIQLDQQTSFNISGSDNGLVTILANNITIANESQIIADALDNSVAGGITIQATETFSLNSNSSLSATTNNISNTGIINITGNFVAIEESSINNFTNGAGNSGGINIIATDSFTMQNSFMDAGTNGEGEAGEINYTAETILIDSSTFINGTTSSGNGGNININANNLNVARTDFGSGTSSSGNGGDINVFANNFIVTQANFGNGTTSTGNSGDINITAKNIIVTQGGFGASASSSGDSGDISIFADNLTISQSGFGSDTTGSGNGAIINLIIANELLFEQSGFGSNTSGSGRGGTINIQASTFTMNQSGFASDSRGSGDGGEINLNVGTFVMNQSGFSSNTADVGDSGEINLNVGTFTMNESDFDSNTTDIGNGGEMNLNVDTFTMNESSFSSNTTGTGNGGEINLNVDTLLMKDSNFSANTEGAGDAGNIFVDASEITLQENISSITAFSQTNGAAGSVQINTHTLSLSDRAQISVSNTGTGDAGNLNINADTIFLDTQSSLQGEVFAGNQGNINLNSQFLLLRHNSNITTNAGNTADGGNINIDTANLVILEDSHISANAIQGQGGNILITTQGLFLSPDGQISASSQFGIDGLITINNPDLDNSIAVIGLPSNVRDPSQEIVRVCGEGRENTLIVTGRGGLPAKPDQILDNEEILEDLGNSSAQTDIVLDSPISKPSPTLASFPPILEATSWIVNQKGNVELVAVINAENTLPFTSHCASQADF